MTLKLKINHHYNTTIKSLISQFEQSDYYYYNTELNPEYSINNENQLKPQTSSVRMYTLLRSAEPTCIHAFTEANLPIYLQIITYNFAYFQDFKYTQIIAFKG